MKKLLMRAYRWRVRTQRDQITTLLIILVQQLTYMPLYTLLHVFDLGFRDWLILYTSIGVARTREAMRSRRPRSQTDHVFRRVRTCRRFSRQGLRFPMHASVSLRSRTL